MPGSALLILNFKKKQLLAVFFFLNESYKQLCGLSSDHKRIKHRDCSNLDSSERKKNACT